MVNEMIRDKVRASVKDLERKDRASVKCLKLMDHDFSGSMYEQQGLNDNGQRVGGGHTPDEQGKDQDTAIR